MNDTTPHSSEPKHIICLRHGETALNGTLLGRTDVPLSTRGRGQIMAKQEFLASCGIRKILCSPLQRCRESAELLALSCPMVIEDDLQEIDFGEWDGKTFTETAASSPELVEQWASDEAGFTFPCGESIVDFRGRVEKCAQGLYKEEAPLLIISHSGVLRHLLCALLHLPDERHLSFRLDYAGVITFDLFPQGGVLTAFNL